MSRYRPIAPKPTTPSNSTSDPGNTSHVGNLWPQLLNRPTRIKKRGRAPLPLPNSFKKHKTHHAISGFCFPCSETENLPNLQSCFLPPLPLLNNAAPFSCSLDPPTLPLLTSPKLGLTMNSAAEEKDLLQNLQRPIPNVSNVIAPHPVRPVGSCINVGHINEDYSSSIPVPVPSRRAQEVEDEVESESLPAVISDSNNRVRMANSAYKEMVGQPQCSWLKSMVTCTRISGEVTLNLPFDSSVPISSNGFSCWVRIDWKSDHKNTSSVNAFCDVMRLSCESKHYLFTWRFHTAGSSSIEI